MSNEQIPKYPELISSVFQALKKMGGSGTNDEINILAIKIAGITDEQAKISHGSGESGRSEVEYRFAWARNCLKLAGMIESSKRAVWSLTALGVSTKTIDGKEVFSKRSKPKKEEHEDPSVSELSWQEKVLEVLLKMKPDAFERLAQRLLRESGFIQVIVIGRAGDGGIDGKGIIRIGGLVSFPVIFQCKRWKGAVGSKEVRDLRGAMVGRADKGLLITTGSFTREALVEATRDGAPAIDLIDGELLAEKLKELGLGIRTRAVEEVEVESDWFATI